MNLLEIRDYAWMSQASYLGLEDVVVGEASSLLEQLTSDTFSESSQFTAVQADEFINDYTLVSHRSENAGTAIINNPKKGEYRTSLT